MAVQDTPNFFPSSADSIAPARPFVCLYLLALTEDRCIGNPKRMANKCLLPHPPLIVRAGGGLRLASSPVSQPAQFVGTLKRDGIQCGEPGGKAQGAPRSMHLYVPG